MSGLTALNIGETRRRFEQQLGPWALAIGLGIGAIFTLDLVTGARWSISALYGLVILLTSDGRRASDSLVVAGLCACLTALAFQVTVQSHEPVRWPQVASIEFCLVATTAAGLWLRQRRKSSAVPALEADHPGVFVWRQDWTSLDALLQQLIASGLTDVAGYAKREPNFLFQARALVSIVDVNAATADRFGPPRDARWMERWSATAPEGRAFFAEALEAYLQGRSQFSAPGRIEAPCGKRIDVDLSIRFAIAAGLDRVLITAVDATDRNTALARAEQTERKLALVARTTTIGALTASIVHELNQPLAALRLNSQAAARWLGREAPDVAQAQTAVARVEKNQAQMSSIIERTRSFLGGGANISQRDVVDLTGVIDDALQLVARDLRSLKISLEMAIAPDLPAVVADRVQILQVLVNLLLNAAHAIGTDLPSDRKRIALSATIQTADAVVIRVEDKGAGIEPTQMKQLFEPYFTTKAQGLGLGLAICRASVEAHGGKIWADSEPNVGSVFSFSLPTQQRELAS